VKQVKKELKRWHPAALVRLAAFPGTRMPPANRELKLRYRSLLTRYRKLIPRDPRHDPADPWLIVSAQQYGYTIVTMETALKEKKYKPKRGIPLPDLCDALQIPWKDLTKLANDEGWH
jgi:hypothetical protein